MADWYLIKNDKGAVCKPKGGRPGCGKVHEYWTHDCRPVAFDKPNEWEFFRRETIVDRGITLKSTETTIITSLLGTVVKITEKEALELNIIKNPPSNPVVVARSFPGVPVRRSGGRQAPLGRLSRTLGG